MCIGFSSTNHPFPIHETPIWGFRMVLEQNSARQFHPISKYHMFLSLATGLFRYLRTEFSGTESQQGLVFALFSPSSRKHASAVLRLWSRVRSADTFRGGCPLTVELLWGQAKPSIYTVLIRMVQPTVSYNVSFCGFHMDPHQKMP